MSDYSQISKDLESQGFVCKEIYWGLGPSLRVSKRENHSEGDLQIIQNTVFVAPDTTGWCVIADGGNQIKNSVASLDEAANLAASFLSQKQT